MTSISDPAKARSMARERKILLANLSKELQASPMYSQADDHQTTARAAASQQKLDISTRDRLDYNARQPLTAFKTVRKMYVGDDLNSFHSFHAEVDPYKSFTRSARLISGHPNKRTSYTAIKPSRLSGQEEGRQPSREELFSTPDNQYVALPKMGVVEENINPNLKTGPLTNFDAASTRDENYDILRQGTDQAKAQNDGIKTD